jgi:hypothetical protein
MVSSIAVFADLYAKKRIDKEDINTNPTHNNIMLTINDTLFFFTLSSLSTLVISPNAYSPAFSINPPCCCLHF